MLENSLSYKAVEAINFMESKPSARDWEYEIAKTYTKYLRISYFRTNFPAVFVCLLNKATYCASAEDACSHFPFHRSPSCWVSCKHHIIVPAWAPNNLILIRPRKSILTPPGIVRNCQVGIFQSPFSLADSCGVRHLSSCKIAFSLSFCFRFLNSCPWVHFKTCNWIVWGLTCCGVSQCPCLYSSWNKPILELTFHCKTDLCFLFQNRCL